MELRLSVAVLIVVALLGVAWGVVGVGAEDNITETFYANSYNDIFVKTMSTHCSQQYSLTCLKLDVVRLVDKLGHSPSYHLFPGISLVHSNYSRVSALPDDVLAPLAEGNDTALDVFLAARVTDYLNSLTLAVKVLDSGTVNSARRLGEQILSGNYNKDLQAGRKKGGGAAVWAAGTMAAVGMAALAAVSGKAMMTSMLALMLAAAGALRGNGGGNDGGGGKCHHAYPAGKRSIAVQERPVYRPAITSTYGPASP